MKKYLVKKRSDNSIEGIESGWEETVNWRTGCYLGVQNQEAKEQEDRLGVSKMETFTWSQFDLGDQRRDDEKIPEFIEFEVIPRTESS